MQFYFIEIWWPNLFARQVNSLINQVLRLWLERKIFPESLLRRYMDDIGVPNEDTSSGFALRRPSRAERAVDDPIREMEGMLVDEYGRLGKMTSPHLCNYVIYMPIFCPLMDH